MLDPVKDQHLLHVWENTQDLYSSIRPVEAGFDILHRFTEIEEAFIVGKILSYCSTATVYSLRQWLDLATTWFVERETQLMKSWAESVPQAKMSLSARPC
jgi:hypothetical protein